VTLQQHVLGGFERGDENHVQVALECKQNRHPTTVGCDDLFDGWAPQPGTGTTGEGLVAGGQVDRGHEYACNIMADLATSDLPDAMFRNFVDANLVAGGTLQVKPVVDICLIGFVVECTKLSANMVVSPSRKLCRLQVVKYK
jgi:hypothetical protein